MAKKKQKTGGRRGTDPRSPAEKLKARMTAKLEELRLAEQLRAVWDNFCENCREKLEGREVWVEVHLDRP